MKTFSPVARINPFSGKTELPLNGESSGALYVYYWIVFAVISLETFAVFANGAYFLGAMTLCAVGNWTILVGALLVNRADATLLRSWPLALPLHLMLLFWLWTGASFFWAYAPDLAWIEFNRTGGYFAVLALGIIAGRHRLPRGLVPPLFLALTVAASLYGLGTKLFPSQIINTDALARISVPMGYTNAMGILIAMGVPLALYLAASRTTRWYIRLAAAASLPLLFIALFFTVSRGAMLALAIGLGVFLIIAPARLRILGMLLLGLAPSVLVAWWGNNQEALMANKVELSQRLAAAGPLRLYLALAILGVAAVFIAALFIGGRIAVPPVLKRVTGVAIIVGVSAVTLVYAWQFLGEKPSISGWAHDTYQEFATGKTSKPGAARLLQVGSQGRFRLWEEAMANWSDHKIAGTGAQSFPLVHLQRQAFDSPFVKQPHGLPFRLLSELGAVGFLLGYAAIAALMTVSLLLLCAVRDRWDRLAAAAMITLMIVYLTHTGYDWDWNMFALTSAFFFFGGLCAGWYADSRSAPARGRRYHH